MPAGPPWEGQRGPAAWAPLPSPRAAPVEPCQVFVRGARGAGGAGVALDPVALDPLSRASPEDRVPASGDGIARALLAHGPRDTGPTPLSPLSLIAAAGLGLSLALISISRSCCRSLG
jgi:hypothetical protein